jgi:hypothetical protein
MLGDEGVGRRQVLLGDYRRHWTVQAARFTPGNHPLRRMARMGRLAAVGAGSERI